MRTIEEHFAAVMATATAVPTEIAVVSPSLLGRVLRESPAAQLAVPPFSNSAMDGFLVHFSEEFSAGFAEELRRGGQITVPVSGDVAAGDPPLLPAPGQAVRIMTGAPVPEDHPNLVVIPVEQTNIPAGPQPLAAQITFTVNPNPTDTPAVNLPRRHIRPRGENLRPGQPVAAAPALIDAGTLAALISAGIQEVRVSRPVRVGVVSSGNELVSLAAVHPGASAEQLALAPGQLPDSNGPMIAALATNARTEVVMRHCPDDLPQLARELAALAADCDVIITTGGVSAGAFDVVRETLQQQATQAWFGHVAQKPGAPQGLSRWGKTPIISLPGNPVAAFVSFHTYVSPLLAALSGQTPQQAVWDRAFVETTATNVNAQFATPPPGRVLLVPAVTSFNNAETSIIPYQQRGVGSHLVASLAGTNSLVVRDAESHRRPTLRAYLLRNI